MSKVSEIREIGMKLLKEAGYQVKRLGKGISYNVQIAPDIIAHVKVGSNGGPIIRAQSMDVNCEFNGLTDQITHLLYINKNRKTDEISVYLIPKLEAIAAFRAAWQSRLEKSGGDAASNMVTISFHDGKNEAETGYQRKFSKYRLQPTQEFKRRDEPVAAITIEEAKAGLAAKFGVPIEAVKITIEM